jgi:hypothetical protein
MPLEIYHSEKVLGLDSVRAMPKHEMPDPWLPGGGVSLVSPELMPLNPVGVKWALAKDSQALWFACEVLAPPLCDTRYKAGEFIEGLWTTDVAEFFLQDAHSGEYQEFNISPVGAWWSCSFSEYRKRYAAFKKPATFCCQGFAESNRWEVVFGVRIDGLSIRFDAGTLVHVAVVSCSREGARGEGDVVPKYFSSHPIRGLEPDFHHPEVFQPYVIKEIELPTSRLTIEDLNFKI